MYQDKKELNHKKKKRDLIPYFIALFFVMIIVINIIFLYLARSTFSGVLTEDAYQKGLSYNDVVFAQSAQEQRGVQGLIEFGEGAQGAQELIFEPNVACSKVEASLIRTVHDKGDMDIIMSQNNHNSYSYTFDQEITGSWFVRIKCYCEGEEFFFSKKFDIGYTHNAITKK